MGILHHVREEDAEHGTVQGVHLVVAQADLATNIAEDVVFLVEGKSIKHRAEDIGT